MAAPEPVIKLDHQAGEKLASEFDAIRKNVESIRSWNSLVVYQLLRRATKERAKVEEQAKALYKTSREALSNSTIFTPPLMLSAMAAVAGQVTQQLIQLVRESQRGGLTILSVLHAQEASSALGAVIERKYAHAFGFISLYIALLSIILGAIGPVLRSEPKASPSSQAFFRVGKPIQFAPASAELRNEDANTDTTTDICNSKRELIDAGSTVAIVVGRHDQTPLSHSGRLRFLSNAGLAQQRAEVVARFLEHASECGPAIPTVIKLAAAPRYVGKGAKKATQLQADREVVIYGLKRVQPKESA